MAHIMLGAQELPPDLRWSDEFSWLEVGASVKTSIGGARIVQIGEFQAGRPITLEGGEEFGWLPYSAVEQLRAMAREPDTFRNLVLADGRTYTVRFRLEELAVEAEPVSHRVSANPAERDAFRYIPIIRLETVNA